MNSGAGGAEFAAGGCWWEVRGGFHSQKKSPGLHSAAAAAGSSRAEFR